MDSENVKAIKKFIADSISVSANQIVVRKSDVNTSTDYTCDLITGELNIEFIIAPVSYNEKD